MNKRKIGSKWEEEAALFLSGEGLFVKERNFSCRFGEIDIIASDGIWTVFVEVKYRKTAATGHPEEAVSVAKAKKISKVADFYRVCRKMPIDAPIRFDVVAIEGSDIRWYKNAFPYTN